MDGVEVEGQEGIVMRLRVRVMMFTQASRCYAMLYDSPGDAGASAVLSVYPVVERRFGDGGECRSWP
jgi:hypothetical protein